MSSWDKSDEDTPPEPEVEPLVLQEPEIQQELADDDPQWFQKGLTDDDIETR